MALNFFLRMLLGHLVGDFILQPYKIALAKRAGWRGLLLHVSIVTITTGVAIYNIIPAWLFWTIILFGVHLLIDQFRTFVFTDNAKGKSLLFFVLDQIVHIISIMIISNLAVGWQLHDLAAIYDSRNLSLQDSTLLLTSLVIIAVWVVPILEVELATAIISRKIAGNKKELVPIQRSDRVMGAMERLVSVGLIIFSQGLFIPLVFLPRLYWLMQKDRSPHKVATYSKSGISFVTALVISLPLWLFSFI